MEFSAALRWIIVCAPFWVASAAAEPPPLLHEFVHIPRGSCTGGACGDSAGDDEPVYLPQPLSPVIGSAGPPLPGDAPPARRDRVLPDRQTGPLLPGDHLYHEVFNPSIAPWKRMAAFDAVASDEALYVWDGARRSLSPAKAPNHFDRFEGSVVLELAFDRWVPLPSVAADAAIVSYELLPLAGQARAEARFASDSAGNHFVAASHASGRYRLNWTSAVSPAYFAGDLPRSVRISDEPRALLHPLPRELQKRAEQVIARIGVDRHAPLFNVIDTLVTWFRRFDVVPLDKASSGSTYLDLALAQRGLCRHRAYAFVVTALALGIPGRYIENELHAFVEVFVPRFGWRQIDLGGGVMAYSTKNADDKRPYERKGEDPFATPPGFQRSGQGTGSSSSSSSPSSSSSSSPSSSTSASTSANASTSTSTSSDLPTPPRARTALQLSVASREAFRGETLHIDGRFSIAPDGPQAELGGVRVILELIDRAGRAVPIADAVTATDGKFSVDVEVPRTLPLGEHRLTARTEGDDAREPARSSNR